MLNYNRVILAGRLTRDPEVRQLPKGGPVAALGMATSEYFRGPTGDKVEKPCFVDVAVFGDAAENCAKYLKKGSGLLVEGKLQFDEWEGKNGERRSKLKVRATAVQFLSGGTGVGSGGEGSGNGNGKRPAGKVSAGAPRAAALDEATMPF